MKQRFLIGGIGALVAAISLASTSVTAQFGGGGGGAYPGCNQGSAVEADTEAGQRRS